MPCGCCKWETYLITVPNYSVVLFNFSLTETQRVQLNLPTPPLSSATHIAITSNSIHDDNEAGTLTSEGSAASENSEKVKLNSWSLNNFSNGYEILLPPHSIHVITWQRDPAAPTYTPTPIPSATATPTMTATPTPDPNAKLTTIQIGSTAVITDVKRLGLNVGSRNRWGAGQFLKNFIDNLDFEAGVYGSAVHAASGSTGTRFEQDFWDTSWNNEQYAIGQPEGMEHGEHRHLAGYDNESSDDANL